MRALRKMDNAAMTGARIVLTTLDDKERATQLANALVESRLAACVNLIEPIRSVYRWKGKIETADEVLLVIKTSADGLPALKDKIRQLHPYELPELLVLPVVDGSEPYLAWLLGAVRPGSE